MTQFNCNKEITEAVAEATVAKIKKQVKGKVVYWHNLLGDSLVIEVYRQGTLMFKHSYTNIADRIFRYENSDSLSADFVNRYKKEVWKHFFK